MEKFVTHTGKTVAIDLANIDTDQIIPKQFLKRIERTGYGEFLFHDWKFTPAGERIESFALNRPEFAGASILVTGDNFGCGSSREHAPWSLLDHGFRVIIAPSFADIFYNNSLKTGLLPIALERSVVSDLMASAGEHLTIDLAAQSIERMGSPIAGFEIDQFRKHCLINGLDDIGLTLRSEDAINAFETRTREDLSFLAFHP